MTPVLSTTRANTLPVISAARSAVALMLMAVETPASVVALTVAGLKRSAGPPGVVGVVGVPGVAGGPGVEGAASPPPPPQAASSKASAAAPAPWRAKQVNMDFPEW